MVKKIKDTFKYECVLFLSESLINLVHENHL